MATAALPVLLIVLLVAACARPSTGSTVGLLDAIGPAGGDVTLDGAMLTVPAGALDREVAITMERIDDADVETVGALPGTAVRLTPSGLAFLTPVTLTLSFDPATLTPDGDIAQLSIHRLNDDGTSTPLPSSVDLEAGTVSAELTSFSVYFVFEALPQTVLVMKTWIGGDPAGPQDWHNESNWSPSGIPGTAGELVIVPATAVHFPRVTQPATAYSLTVEAGVELQLAGAGIGIWGNLVVDGTITSDGTGQVVMQGDESQNLRGHLPNLWVGHGTTRLSGPTVVADAVLVEGVDASLDIGSHRLQVFGDLVVNGFADTRARLLMDHAAGTVIVHGDATFGAAWGGEPTLQRGTLEIRGQLRQKGFADALRAGPLHTVRLAGSGNRQAISFEHPHAPSSGLGFVSLANPGGVALLSDVRVHSLAFDDAGVGAQLVQASGREVVLDVESTLFIRGHMEIAELRVGGNVAGLQGYDYLVPRTVFTGRDTSLPHQEMTMLPYRDVIVDGGEVRVADPFVRVMGDLVLRDGRLRAPEGRVLTIVGDLRTEGSGVLRMEAGDRIVLLGNAQFAALGAELFGGTLWVRGDFDAAAIGTFATSDEQHTTVFFGTRAQALRGEPIFGTLAVVNTGDGLTIHAPAPFGFQEGPGRLLDLVGNTRVPEDRVVTVTNVVYRSSSRTHFEEWAYFNCDTVWLEDGFVVSYDGTTFGCWRGNRKRGAADATPPLGDYTPPSFVQSVIESPANDAYDVGDTVEFFGYALTDYETIEVQYEWFSSRDGLIGTTASFTRDDLSEGVHVIELRTTTADGVPSFAYAIIRVGDPPLAPPELTSIVVSPAEADVPLRGSRSFTAQAFDQYGQLFFGADIVWTVTNPCVASISENGFLRAIGVPGPVTVSASTEDVSGSASVRVLTDTGTPPDNVTGHWVVCRRTTGEVVLYLDLVQEDGSTAVTGRVTRAGSTLSANLISPLNRWQDNTLYLTWTWLIQGGERQFAIQEGVGFDTNAIRARYNDRVVFQVYDVDLVRVDPQ